MTEIKRVAVIGAGTMGSGIAEACAKGGAETIVVELNADVLARSEANITGSLDKAVARGKATEADREGTLSRMRFSTSIDDLADRDLVIEAIIESEPAKVSLFQSLDRITPPSCILATNTSSIPIINLATATSRGDKVVGIHFFNPAQVQPLVEVVRALTTSDSTVSAAADFCTATLGKKVIHCGDRAGFIVNRLLVPYLLSAIRMLDSGLATARDIDDGMKGGCAHPMGPLELSDLVGLDTLKAVADVLHEEWNEPHYAAPPLLKRLVAAGRLGRKTKAGFYDY